MSESAVGVAGFAATFAFEFAFELVFVFAGGAHPIIANAVTAKRDILIIHFI
jgi:hypothetical protein